LSIKFRPGRLGKKPDALTHHWDIYNRMDTPLRTAKKPLFAPEQLAVTPEKASNPTLRLQAAVVTDPIKLLANIQEALKTDPVFLRLAGLDGTHEDTHWQLGEDGLLYFKNQIYVPESQNLRLQVIQLRHDHILAGHPGQSKTYQLIHREFYWPNLRESVTDYVRSCNTCACNKTR